MAQLIKPNSVKILTQEGEVTIHLEITINLNSDGLNVSTQAVKNNEIKKEKEKESNEWMIPDFGDSPKIDFGK